MLVCTAANQRGAWVVRLGPGTSAHRPNLSNATVQKRPYPNGLRDCPGGVFFPRGITYCFTGPSWVVWYLALNCSGDMTIDPFFYLLCSIIYQSILFSSWNLKIPGKFHEVFISDIGSLVVVPICAAAL